MDNSCEFVNQDFIEQSVITKNKRTTVYYAHPYSSCERASNENINKIIRRFIPKTVLISLIKVRKIKDIEFWLNNYPRRMLNGASVYEFKKSVA